MFSKRLYQARKACGLSLRELSEKVGISHAAIKKYEDGKANPSSDILLKLSKALQVRTEYFFRQEPLPSVKEIKFRKHKNFPKKQLDTITYKVLEKIERRIELENLFPKAAISFKETQNKPDIIKSIEQVEELADTLRNTWKLGIGPIPDLIDTLEMQGIRVFTIEHNENNIHDKFDGLHTVINKVPIIVINENDPGDRQRFTLAHELGHLILENKLGKAVDEETACNRFAGAFLFPKESVFKELGETRRAIELKELDLLKQEFGVSMQCIMHRAEELNIINKSIFNNLNRIFKSKGWDLQEPGKQYPREVAHFFNQFVFHALAEDCIGESKAAELLSLPLTDFRRMRAMEGKDANTHQ